MKFRNPNDIRSDFSVAMSEMYKSEVPAYGQLMKIVRDVNDDVLNSDLAEKLNHTPREDTQRISEERHGAIRLGTPKELNMMARIFAVMGMQPVGYYDLSVASVPVHSTAFRPVNREDLASNPFRVFTSLLRLELIEDTGLRAKAESILSKRKIFSDVAIELTTKAEKNGGLDKHDATVFIREVLETFRWHRRACVDVVTFDDLIAAHRLIADVVSFRGPHINHLTPRTLDIDVAQSMMIELKLPAKAIVEGPPRRGCPILLRQTAFKALDEDVEFPAAGGEFILGHHTARFGEIEQRGVALTQKGRTLYDSLLNKVRAKILPAADGSNAKEYMSTLESGFEAFPDNWREMHDQELAYFKYNLTGVNTMGSDVEIHTLLDKGVLTISPIIYEDFLPVSAAGIFQSNLGDEAQSGQQAASSKQQFEAALGRTVLNEFMLYEAIQNNSLKECMDQV